MTEASPARGPGARRAVTSRAQDGAWFLDRLVPGSPAHHVHRAYRVTGDLDLVALEAAWREVAARHDILRTTLVDEAGRPAQHIAARPAPALTLTTVDLTASLLGSTGSIPAPRSAVSVLTGGAVATGRGAVLPVAAEAAALRWCAGQVAAPFDLAAGPLARLAAARLAPGEYALVMVLHRAVADDRSLTLLAEEVSACYAGAAAGRPPGAAPPPPGLQYADFARRQRERESTPEFARLRDAWISALRAPESPLAGPPLPVDRPRPAGPSPEGDSIRFDWGPELARDLAALARAEGTTPFAVLLAASQCLFGRYGREDRPVLAVTADARPPGYERVAGPCTDLQVLRGDLSGAPSFREVLRRAARLAMKAHEHREVPFDELVRALNPERDPYRVPLADVMLVWRDLPEPELAPAGTAVRSVAVGGGAARSDLALVVDRASPSVRGCLEYRESLFERASARMLLGQLRTLLTAALREPDLPAGALPLEDPARLAAAVRDADRIADAPPARPVNDLFHRRARSRPEAAAVAWDGAEVSYREIEELAAPLTAALRAGGGVDGLPVAVRVPQGPRQVAALLGVLDAGAYLVCLGTGDTGERGKAVLADLAPARLVLDGEAADGELAGWYRRELGGQVVDMAALPATAAPSTAHETSTAHEASTATSTAHERRAYVAYTSGSTGRPKGIPQSHAALARFVTWFAAEFRIGPGARVAQWAAPGYDASLVEIFATLAAGATLCPVPDRTRANPDRMAGWLAAERLTHFQTVPSFARQLLTAVADQGVQGLLGGLGHLLLAGEPLAGEVVDQVRATLPWVRTVNLYGPTETILATWHEVTGPVRGVAPIGRSIPGRQVLVLDDQDRPCPAGVTGQIVIRGPHITPGYVGAAAGERAPFLPLAGFDPACRGYRTGDLGRRRWDGSLEFGGRGDFQVKFNGVRMELTDIEAALAAHPSVAECAVVAVADRTGLVTRLIGYVVPRPTAPDLGGPASERREAPDAGGPPQEGRAGPEVWRAALRLRFGKAMPPVSFKTLDALPRNVGGKVDRNALPRPAPSAARPGGPPRGPVEAEVAAVWSELLGGRRVEADTTFFAAGGHSLLIPRLLDRIRGRFGTAISVARFLADPTPAGLAALVEARAVPKQAVIQTMMG
ncbi:AMP-binding protein [Sphaerisporangium sp. NPDC005289]|uniref:non-ribosomal peptide synthetase n=1 Tax=Sphaerisporangium sp. NPDC005289 TaxID=3155247 RepID=UPI0033B8F696